MLEAIRVLEYRPSSVAQALSLKRTLVIGVVLPFLTEASPIERVRGVVTALASSPYDLALYDVESADRQQRAFRLLADAHRTDGLLVVSLIPPDEEVRRLRAGSIPCVLIDAHHDGLPSVVIDDVAGGELATRYLLELGHRRIAFIGDKPADPFRRQSSRDRTIGYERALAAASIPVRRDYVREGTQSRHLARNIAEELLRLPEPPTAVFAASDVQALGVLEAARGLGIDVPEQLSVIGFDDIEIATLRRADDGPPAAVRERPARRGAAAAGARRRAGAGARRDAAARPRRARHDSPAALTFHRSAPTMQ